MRVAIVGAGGVGGYLGARLAESGQDVTFIARGAHLAAMLDHGLRLESPLGDALIKPVAATDDPGTIGPVDLVLFAVKLYDTEAAAEACRPLLGPETGVVTFQNGVDSVAVLSRVLGEKHVIGGVAKIASVIARPGTIRHTGTMAQFVFGELDGRRSARIEALADALANAGVDHAMSEAIEVEIWRKMVFLASFAGITALIRLPIGPIRADPHTRSMYQDAVAEAAGAARASGVELPDDVVEQNLAHLDRLPYEMKSSMLEDLERGRQLELPWLSGAIARMGSQLGVPTPVHAFITTALKLHADGRA